MADGNGAARAACRKDSNPKPIKGAIFDVDGTLLDSMFFWETIAEEYLRSLGIEPHTGLNEKFKSMSLYQTACHYQSEYGVTLPTTQIMAGINARMEGYYRQDIQLKKGVAAFLENLKRRGVKMCIATATDRSLIEAALERLQIRRYFLEIFTCTSVGHGKDEPVIFERALSFLRTAKPETVVFEDALYAVRTAKSAGFRVIAMQDNHEPYPESVRAIADYYVHDFCQVEELLFYRPYGRAPLTQSRERKKEDGA